MRRSIVLIFCIIILLLPTNKFDFSVPAQIETNKIKFMTYNIEASGQNNDWKTVVKEENADIISFVETGSWDDNNNNLLKQYCDEMNDYFTDEEPYECVGTESIPYETSGEAIFSRYPIKTSNQITEVDPDGPVDTYDVSHDFLDVTITINNFDVHFIASHLKCCSGSENEVKRETQQEGIINYMDSLGSVPIVYAGDLNSFSPLDTGILSPEGNLGYGPVNMLMGTNGYEDSDSEIHEYRDVFRALNPSDPGYTYGHQDEQYTSRIDFIFTNQFISDDLLNSTVGDTHTAFTGSDHYSVDMTIDFDADANGTAPEYKSADRLSELIQAPINISPMIFVIIIYRLARSGTNKFNFNK